MRYHAPMQVGQVKLGNLALGVDGILGISAAMVLVVVAAIVIYWLGSRIIHHSAKARIGAMKRPGAARRIQTAETLLQHTWRYVVLFGAALSMIALFRGGAVPAVIFTSVAGVALGFGSQSLLKDLIAGIFMIFEGQFAVGDRVKLFGVDISGEIVEAGLRVTVLRDVDGHLYYVPNGAITAVMNISAVSASEGVSP